MCIKFLSVKLNEKYLYKNFQNKNYHYIFANYLNMNEIWMKNIYIQIFRIKILLDICELFKYIVNIYINIFIVKPFKAHIVFQ